MKAIQKLRNKVVNDHYETAEELVSAFENLKSEAELRKDELEDKFNDLSEKAQDGTSGETLMEKIETLGNFITEMEDMNLEIPTEDVSGWIEDRQSELENIDL